VRLRSDVEHLRCAESGPVRLRADQLIAVCLALAAACGGNTQGPSDTPDAANVPEAGASLYAAECAGADVPPPSLECTGLYANIATKEIATGIREYAPAVPLWADNATKVRWIYLPPGTTIDTTDPSEWTFPVGTKIWKEFSKDGKRVETRLFQKVQTGYWVYTTYAWNAGETAAMISSGGNIPWGDGGVYHIPTPDECDQCHRGRTDHILGFEQVSLGLAGASGVTLADLVSDKLLTPAPALTSLAVGDDGTGVAAMPLEWLHINCGVSCHNDNSNSTAYGSSMRLRLDPTLLDGRPSTDFDSRTTTLGMTANNPMWNNQIRIVPGDPTHSLLVQLISNRGTDNPEANQMPPIATSVVDVEDTQNVVTWIGKMPPLAVDGGMSDGGAVDGGMSDGGAVDDAAGDGGN
jgi:hypothetical protein